MVSLGYLFLNYDHLVHFSHLKKNCFQFSLFLDWFIWRMPPLLAPKSSLIFILWWTSAFFSYREKLFSIPFFLSLRIDHMLNASIVGSPVKCPNPCSDPSNSSSDCRANLYRVSLWFSCVRLHTLKDSMSGIECILVKCIFIVT